MRIAARLIRLQSISVIAITLLLCAPLVLHAQASSQTDLNAAIRAEILKDPRSSSFTAAELDAMVSALTSKAQSQGITAQSLTYRPGVADPSAVQSSRTAGCTDVSSPLCPLGQALGFDSPDKRVPIGLWITSALLIIVIWHMRKNPHLAYAKPSSKPPTTGPLG